MLVRDIMTTAYETIPVGDSIYHAALIMRDEDLGMLPVVSEDGTSIFLLFAPLSWSTADWGTCWATNGFFSSD